MSDLLEGPEWRVDRLIGRTVDLLRWLGARPLSNGLLRLLRSARRDKVAVPATLSAKPGVPIGPFVTMPGAPAPAVLLFVPRRLQSRLIDAATGGYGYSHLTVDCGEIDRATGKRVMIESMPGHPVRRVFLDAYGWRPFARIVLRDGIADFDAGAFCACVTSKIGEVYDTLEALTWGEVDNPAKQVCTDLATVCLPRELLDSIAARHAAGGLPRRSVAMHHGGTPRERAFVSPNAFAVYLGAPPGERLPGPDTLVGDTAGPKRARRPRRVKLIYNPAAGGGRASGSQLMEILSEMQGRGLLPEVHLVAPDSHIQAVVGDALRRGIRLIVVSAGDGTVDEAMGALVGTSATLGIIPTGTRNNIAYSLGIPIGDIPSAVGILCDGQRLKVDVARASCDGTARWFLEAAAAGLVSDLFPASDQLQHGDLARVTDLVNGFLSAAPAAIDLTLDGEQTVHVEAGHAVLVVNMPYIGARFHPVSDVKFDDGRLDVLVLGGLGKLDLLTYAVQLTAGKSDDPRVTHYKAQSVEVRMDPGMSVMADGVMLGNGSLKVKVHPHALRVMARRPRPEGAVAVEPDPNQSQKEVNDVP